MMIRQTTTRPSLLIRVRDPHDHAAWSEFDRRYGELILRHCLSRGLQAADAEDVRQTVLISLVRSLPQFSYAPQRGRFRSYLGRAVQNAIYRHARRRSRAAMLLEGVDAAQAEADDRGAGEWDRQWVQHHLRRALRCVRQTSDPRSVEVFEECLAGTPTAAIAARFDMSPAAVQKVKQRMRERIRELVRQQVAHEEGLGAP